MEARVSTLETDLTAAQVALETVTPWIGPEGQLRVRLERSEQALLALISDPNNPASSAQRAQAILTAIPAPQA